MKYGPFGLLLGKLIEGTMHKMQKQVTVGQRLYYETGEKVKLEDVKAVIAAERNTKN